MKNQKEIGLFLIISTIIILIGLILLDAGPLNSIILAMIFLVFVISLIDNLLGLFLFIILRPCLGLFIHDSLIEIGGLTINTVSLVGGLTLIFSGFVIFKHFERIKKLPLVFFWLLFIAIALIGIPFSIDVSASLKEIIRILSIFSLFGVGFILIKNNKNLSSLIKVVVFSGLIPALVAIFQFFAGINLPSPEEDVANRVFGTFSHPNLLAFYLIVSLSMCCLIFLVSDRKKVSITGFAILSAILALALGLTYTRGAWIGFLIVVLALGLYKYRRFLIVAALVLMVSFFSSGQIQSRIGSFTRIDPYGSIQFRLSLWKDSYTYFQEKPLLGHGTDSAPTLIKSKRPSAGSVHPHNDYIKFALENGLIGLAAYLLLALALLNQLVIFLRNEKRPRMRTTIFLVLALSASLYIVSLGDNMFKNTSLMWSFWTLLGGLMAMQVKKTKAKKV